MLLTLNYNPQVFNSTKTAEPRNDSQLTNNSQMETERLSRTWMCNVSIIIVNLTMKRYRPHPRKIWGPVLCTGRRDEDKKWNINLRSSVKYKFSQYFDPGTDEPVIRGYRKKKMNGSLDHQLTMWSWNGIIYDRSVDNLLDISPVLSPLFYGPRGTSSQSLKTQKKKKKNSVNIQPFWPHAWSITHVNIFHAGPYKSGKGRQYKKCTSEPGICLTYKSVDFLFLVTRFMKC